MNLKKKAKLQQKRRWRVRKKISGSAERPRLCVHFSGKHIYAQCIDDQAGRTLVYLSSLDKGMKEKNVAGNLDGATLLGGEIGRLAKEAGIERVVFDRAGRLYHGRVKTFADSAREAGLQF